MAINWGVVATTTIAMTHVDQQYPRSRRPVQQDLYLNDYVRPSTRRPWSLSQASTVALTRLLEHIDQCFGHGLRLLCITGFDSARSHTTCRKSTPSIIVSLKRLKRESYLLNRPSSAASVLLSAEASTGMGNSKSANGMTVWLNPVSLLSELLRGG